MALAGLFAACGAHPTATREIRPLLLPDCGLDDVTRLQLEALDDVEPRPASFAQVDPRAATDLVSLPPAARIILASGISGGGLGVSGVLRAEANGGLAAGALFRDGRACGIPLPDGRTAHFSPFVSPAIASSDRGALLAGGHGEDGVARADAIFVDGWRTEATRIAAGMLHPRDEATALALGGFFVVAGGHDEDHFWPDFEVLDSTVRPFAFDRHALALSEVRVESASVVLTSGDGLLIGGRSNDGKALKSMEVIDAKSLSTRIVDVARLDKARRGPRAVRLATGEIAVVGGRDSAGAAVADIEILAPNAGSVVRTIAFTPHATIDAFALPSGALLLASTDPPATTVDLWLVRLDGTTEALASPTSSGRAPRWLAASDGAPFLWDGAFRRFDPFNGTLVDARLPSTLAPDPEIDPFALGLGVVAVARINSIESVSVLSLFAARYDLRTELTSDETLGLGSTVHLSADRRAGVIANRAGLELDGGARIAITDVTFGAFSLRIGGGGRRLPRVELRTEVGVLVARIGDDAPPGCAWPVTGAAEEFAELVRDTSGGLVLRIGTTSQICPVVIAAEVPRVSITLVAPSDGGASIHGITVTRGG